MVEVDEPRWILEHQHVVVGEVRHVQEGLAIGFDAENRMAVGVAWSGDNGHGAVEDLVSVFMQHQIRLKGVERVTDILNHPLDVIGAVRVAEVGLRAAPEVHFRFEDVDGGVRVKNLIIICKATDVVDVGVRKESMRDLLGRDPDGVGSHRFSEPTPGGIVVRAEASVEEQDFFIPAK